MSNQLLGGPSVVLERLVQRVHSILLQSRASAAAPCAAVASGRT
jgi:hypothetical protein